VRSFDYAGLIRSYRFRSSDSCTAIVAPVMTPRSSPHNGLNCAGDRGEDGERLLAWLARSALKVQTWESEQPLQPKDALYLSGESTICVATLAIRGERAEAGRLLACVQRARVVPSSRSRRFTRLWDDAPKRPAGWSAYTSSTRSMVFHRVDPQIAALRGDPALERIG